MKKLLNNLQRNRNAKINLLLILVLLFTLGLGCKFNTGGSSDSDDTKTEKTTDDDEQKDKDSDKDDKTKEKADASTGEVPSDEALQALVKETMLDFNDAITEKDFSDFYEKIAKTWQKQIKPGDLDKGFEVFTKNNADFSDLKSMEAEFEGTPEVKRKRGTKVLEVNGSYDTSPRKVSFELEYIPEKKDWKLIAIRVRAK